MCVRVSAAQTKLYTPGGREKVSRGDDRRWKGEPKDAGELGRPRTRAYGVMCRAERLIEA